MNDVNDSDLIRKCLQGERKAFEEIIDKYQKTIFNITLRILNNLDDAADVTQSAFIKVFEHLSEFKPKYKFFSWIYKIAINESYNTLKKRQQLHRISEELKSNDKNPEEKYRDTERSEKIQEALNKLSIDYRAIIVLCYFYGQSYSDIGYILDIPENKVKSRLFTARQLLRDLLIKEDLL